MGVRGGWKFRAKGQGLGTKVLGTSGFRAKDDGLQDYGLRFGRAEVNTPYSNGSLVRR